MTDVLREAMQRLQAAPSREAAAGHERRSVRAVQQRSQSRQTAGDSSDLLDIVAPNSPIAISNSERLPFAPAVSNHSRTNSNEALANAGAAISREDVGQPNSRRLVDDSPASEAQVPQPAASRASTFLSPSIVSTDEAPAAATVHSPTGAAINLAGIVDMVRDELRPMLDDLGERMARTVRSDGNSRQFRVRANQVD